MTLWFKRREPTWDSDQEHWSFSMVGEFYLHDAAHCRHWYGKTFCLRHAQA